MRPTVLFVLATIFCVGSALAAPSPATVVTPVFDPGNFGNSTQIDNPYFPLRPGTTFVYDGIPKGHAEHNEVQVTHDTKVIQGVPCVAVRDRVWIKDVLEEDTIDWYAQDRAGNVWYMGEAVSEYKNGVLVGHDGSWEAGVNGARPGYIMEADPKVGDAYQQEFLAGEAEDAAQVSSLSESVSVPYGSWAGNVLVTREWSPLEPAVVETKFYVRGIGHVKADTVKGGSAASELVEIRND